MTIFKDFNFGSGRQKLTYLLMTPLIGLAVCAFWSLQALHEAQVRQVAVVQAQSSFQARIQSAQAAGNAAAAADLEKSAQQEMQRATSAADDRYRQLQMRFAAVFVLAALIGVVLRAAVRRSILSSTRLGAEAAERIAEGDLTVQIEVPSSGQSKATLAAMKKMIEDLRGLVGGVAASARAVADSTAQIAQGNHDLSQRTEEQASTLEETASSMEELSSTVMQTADNARQASQLAVGASQVARKGGHAVGQVVATMTGISESSRRIGDIIGVIDGIAFQTNILALNAAVEAARAGDQGRGFAVVASEVRSLAQRSAAAAKEIKALIGDSMEKVEAGTRQVDAAGSTMQEIVAAVGQVSELIAGIAAASQEQSSGIGQVNTAVAQLEHLMQQNASLAEQATAATEALKGQADLLLQMVSRFKIGERDRPVSPVGAAGPAPIRVRPATNALPPGVAAYSRRMHNQPVTDSEWQEL